MTLTCYESSCVIFFLKFPSYIEQSIAFYLMDDSKPDVILAQDFEIWQNLEDVKEKSIN